MLKSPTVYESVTVKFMKEGKRTSKYICEMSVHMAEQWVLTEEGLELAAIILISAENARKGV